MEDSPTTKRPTALEPLPPALADALEEVCWYLWEAEITRCVDGEPAPGETHRLRTITVVEHWGDGHYEAELARDLDGEDACEFTGTDHARFKADPE